MYCHPGKCQLWALSRRNLQCPLVFAPRSYLLSAWGVLLLSKTIYYLGQVPGHRWVWWSLPRLSDERPSHSSQNSAHPNSSRGQETLLSTWNTTLLWKPGLFRCVGFCRKYQSGCPSRTGFFSAQTTFGPEHHQSYWPLREENGLLVCAFKTEKRKKNILVDSSGNTWASIISLENIPGNSNCTKFSLV